jgi:phosphoglycolate phosphatase-like HAD superfamily hydrolase
VFDNEKQVHFEENLYNIISNHKIIEISGAKRFIELLERETDFGVCFATGSLYRSAKYKLDKINIEYNSDLLVASNDLEEREKLIEKAIENALKYYNVNKFDRIISFGDGIWDLLTAQNLNIEFVGIGKVNYEIMMQNGMKKHFTDLAEIKINEI